MIGLSDLRRKVKRLSDPNPPRAERRAAPGLAACYKFESIFTPAGIKNISSTGIYLWTDKRPRTGDEVSLSLWDIGGADYSSDLEISIPARVARRDKDGIGLKFVLPPGMNTSLWELLLRNIVVLPGQRQVAELFRTLRAMLFLSRLCPSKAEEAINLLSGRLPPHRTSILVKIAIGAEKLLAAGPAAERMQAHPKLVTDILCQGSWIPDEPTARLWMGLLANSCSVDAPDDSNAVFARLLGHFTPSQTRIFVHGCEWALDSAAGHEDSAAGSLVLGPKEMSKLTGVYDPYRNATELAYLFNLGLIQEVFDFTSYHPADNFDITPSSLGLELYKRCHGCHEKLKPNLVEAANAHLDNFLPAPQPADSDHHIFPLLLPSPAR